MLQHLHEIFIMEIAGFLAAALIGISLGLMGGGGSILTVPVLVYLFRMQPLYATSYSLFVVGVTSLTGAFANYVKGLVNIRIVLLFGISSFITVFITRKWLIPIIPDPIAIFGKVTLTSAALTMTLFAMLMIMAALGMLRTGQAHNHPMPEIHKLPFIKLTIYGVAIGLVTGLLGAGGGFLLIPVLVLMARLSMKEAVGTSLLIIAINSLVGFAGDLGHFAIEWKRLLLITLIAVAGVFAGTMLAQKIAPQNLKKAFGWFVLVIGLVILVQQLLNQPTV